MKENCVSYAKLSKKCDILSTMNKKHRFMKNIFDQFILYNLSDKVFNHKALM